MLEGVACKGGMISLNIHFEVLVKSVPAKKSDSGSCIKIVLMFHRLLRFRLYVKISFKSDFSAVIHCHMHKSCDVILFKFNICIKQCFIALTAAPENITLASELNGYIKSFFNLRSCKAVNISRICTACTVHIAWIAEHIGSTPKTLYICILHFFQNIIAYLIKPAVCLVDIISFRY